MPAALDAGVGDDERVLVAGGLRALAQLRDAPFAEHGLDSERERWHVVPPRAKRRPAIGALLAC